MAESGFPKTARLLRRVDFVRTREEGHNFADGPLAASYRERDGSVTRAAGAGAPAVARVGITVSSRVGGAVLRNRIKRKLREAVRSELSLLPPVDLVVVARASAAHASVADFRLWLRKAADRMRGGPR